MWVEFVGKGIVAKRIFPDRTAFYYRGGDRFDLPPEWCAEWIAAGSAREIAPPITPEPEEPWLPTPLGDEPLTVACVWRTGGIYDRHDYVGPLARAVRRNLGVPHRVVCLTDSEAVPEGVERIPLLHNWPHFWSKIELYRPGLFRGPVLYCDLDTIICGPLDEIATRPEPLLISWDMQHGWINSSMLRWSVDLSFVYDVMVANPAAEIERYNGGGPFWGDQGLLQDTLVHRRVPWRWMQDALPERVRWHPPGSRDRAPEDGVSVSLWYGHPKPHEATNNRFVRQHWLGVDA